MATKGTLITICGWCKKHLGTQTDVKGIKGTQTVRGLCAACEKKHFPED